MKRVLIFVLVLGCGAAASLKLRAQSQPASQPQSPPAAQQPDRSQQQSNQNPFPEDTNNVPVMPTANIPGLPPGAADDARNRMLTPPDDVDPVRSPEEAGAAAESGESSSSSSRAGMASLLPDTSDDDATQPGKRNRKGQQIAPEHQESAAEDENVGKYYLDNKDWRAALSRFQSALVLDPDNPVVYWGLAESERHLGNLADARTNYQKVVDYDPDSRLGKDARKELKDPTIANAKASAQPPPAAQPSIQQ
jgi:tetratricopeptide (TPR) repeat protein